jgi:hypothetical protein
MVSACETVARVASLTWMVKLKTPPAVGVPEIIPVAGVRLSPVGKEPSVTDHAKGAVSPAVVRDFEYAASTVPTGNVADVMDSVPATLIAKACAAVAPELSLTLRVKFDTPTVVGVPEMVPLAALRLRPGVNVPADMDHVSAALPPVDVTVWAYATLAVPAGNDVVVMEGGAAIAMARDFEAEAWA